MGYLNTTSLQISCSVQQWKNCENRLTSGEVTESSIVSCFLTHSVERYYYKKLCYRDATCQSKSWQLLRNGVGTICTTSPEEIEVMELEGYSRPTYNELVHSAMTLDSCTCNPHADRRRVCLWSHQHTDLWRWKILPERGVVRVRWPV